MISALVNAVCETFPSDRECVSTMNKEKWYKIVGNQMFTPPPQALRANFAELDRFSEAVNNFKHYDINQPAVNWTTPIVLHNTPNKVFEFGWIVTHLPDTTVSVDIECWHTGWDNNPILCIGFYFGNNVQDEPTAHIVSDFSPESIEILQDVFLSEHLTFIWHNGKFDIGRLRYTLGIRARVDEDTMLMHYSGINEKKGTHGLKILAPLYLQAPKWDDELEAYKDNYCRTHGIKKADFTYNMIPLEVLYPYLAMDVRATMSLYKLFKATVRSTSIPVYKLLIRASNTYSELEFNGIAVDNEKLNALHISLVEKIETSEDEFEAFAKRYWDPVKYSIQTKSKNPGPHFNKASPKQLKWLLETATETKLKSTDKDAIAELVARYPNFELLQSLGRMRTASVYLKTYVMGVRNNLCKDNRIRCSFNLHGTETGRLSCSEPNMQNIPREGEVKDIYMSGDEYDLIELDYSQAELRVLAYLSSDSWLTQIYLDDTDLHDAVATEIFGVHFTSEQRVLAKNVNFGIVYGVGASTLAKKCKVPFAVAKKTLTDWFKPMPTVKKWIDKVRSEPHRGIVYKTFLGRERHYVITNENHNGISNEAANFPVQSTASDLTMTCVCDLQDWINEMHYQDVIKIVNNVHDSILIQVKKSSGLADVIITKGKAVMAGQSKLLPNCIVPFKADAKVGRNWGSLKKWA